MKARKNESLRQKKIRARSIREGYNPTSANETHRMGLWTDGPEDKPTEYIVAPTIRPVDREGNYVPQSINEAEQRGETFEFKNKRIAERFAYGSWKKGRDRRDAMKAYRRDKRNES